MYSDRIRRISIKNCLIDYLNSPGNKEARQAEYLISCHGKKEGTEVPKSSIPHVPVQLVDVGSCGSLVSFRDSPPPAPHPANAFSHDDKRRHQILADIWTELKVSRSGHTRMHSQPGFVRQWALLADKTDDDDDDSLNVSIKILPTQKRFISFLLLVNKVVAPSRNMLRQNFTFLFYAE